jgi:predicted nucleotidyltransferase component of viral defense system
VLTDTQLEIARTVLSAAGQAGFALAGGGAMIVLGAVDRSTRDLDFFTQQVAEITDATKQVEARLAEAGFTVSRKIDSDGFVRMEVRRGDEVCEVDLGHDARRWPTAKAAVGPTISLEELGADKTLALLGRAAPRDFVDVHALEQLFGWGRLCELAADKDLGFNRRYLAETMRKIESLDREQFDLEDGEYDELRNWALRSPGVLREDGGAFEREHDISCGRDRDPPGIDL